jgi:hypothetical protein
MKIKNIDVKISAVAIAVVAIFTIFLSLAYYYQRDWHLLAWGVPMLAMLVVIPLALNYMSQSSYIDLIPEYERQAKKVRVKAINPNMIGQTVYIEGVVERVYFKYLNRPQYLVADTSGEISVKMFTSPNEDIKKGDIVQVLGGHKAVCCHRRSRGQCRADQEDRPGCGHRRVREEKEEVRSAWSSKYPVF